MPVTTVRGVIEADQLGVTSAHEHLLIDLSNQFRPFDEPEKNLLAEQKISLANVGVLTRNPLALKDNLILDEVDVSAAEASLFKKAGGGTIVDLTSIGLGRRPADLRRISEISGVHVVAGCAYYYADTHPKDMDGKTVEQIKREIIHDLQVGIDGTDVRAGVIGEIGISPEMHPNEEKVLIAAAQAQAESGAGIHVHIFAWTNNGEFPLGLKALDILEKHGARADKVTIDHVDVAVGIKLDYCQEIVRRGAYIEFDNFGHEFYVDRRDRKFIPGSFATDVQRAEAIKFLVDAGCVDKIQLANDVCVKNMWHRYGGWGYDHLLLNAVPMLLEKGVSQKDIDTMLVDNPRKFLNIPAKR